MGSKSKSKKMKGFSDLAPKLLANRTIKSSSFSKIHLYIFILVFAAVGYIIYRSFAASLPNIYVAQSSTGLADGSSCANAQAVSFFNTASNWGSGSNQIGAGTIIHLCGTLSTNLTAQGSGSSGSPITILFENGAKLSEPACPGRGTGCLNLNGKSYITVDGGTNGMIENTDNGTSLGHQTGSYGIEATSCANCEVKNLIFSNIYVHSGTSSEIDQTAVRAIEFSGSNFLFHDNTIHDVGWAVTFGGDGDQNDKIYNNNIYNVDHGITPGFSGTSSAGPLFIYNNHFHDFGNWDTANNAYHHDGIHCFSAPSSAGEHLNGLYIYNNRFDGDIGGNATSWIFLEGGSGAGSTPCNDNTSTIYVFNNYLASTPHWSSNDMINISYGNVFEANNTIVGIDPTNNNLGNCIGIPNNTTTAYNNAVGGCNQLINGASGATVDNNAYANCTGSFNCFWIGSTDTANFQTYQSQTGYDAHSVFGATAATGTNVGGVGKNLTSMCTGNLVPLCSDINGNPRPSTGPWDAGSTQLPRVNVWMDPAGSNSAVRCASAVDYSTAASQNCVFKDFGYAYLAAHQGDTVLINPGSYDLIYPGDIGSAQPEIPDDATKTVVGSYVNFTCADSSKENVQINSNAFYLWGDHVKIDGQGNWRTQTPSCMRFPGAIYFGCVGCGSAGHYSDDSVVTGVHAQSVQLQGAHNVTVTTSELGPSVACQKNGSTTSYVDGSPITSATWCQNDPTTGEQWYYQHNLASCDEIVDTHIGWANSGTNTGQNITLTNNWMHDNQTRDPGGWAGDAGEGCHIGGMSSHGAVNGFNFTRNKIEQVVIYDMTLDGTDTNVDIEDNWFGTNVAALFSGCTLHNCPEVSNGFAIYFDNRSGTNFTNWLVRYNTMSQNSVFHNGAITNTYTNFRWIGNLMAGMECDSYILNNPGVTIDYNSIVGSTCGTHSTNLSSLGVKAATGYPINFELSDSPIIPTVPNNGPDYNISSDFYGNSRTYPTPAGATIEGSTGPPPSGGGSSPTPPSPPPSNGSSSPPPTTKKGDCNGDGLVNLTDLSILLTHYNTNYSPAEFDGNPIVSLADLSILLSNYGK